MDNTPPRFNAPIPEYADLNFLFYRWGYDQLGKNGYKLFSKDITRHFYDGLDIRYTDTFGYSLYFFDKGVTSLSFKPFMKIEEFYKLNPESSEVCWMQSLDDFYLNPSECYASINPTAPHGKRSFFFQYVAPENSLESFFKYHDCIHSKEGLAEYKKTLLVQFIEDLKAPLDSLEIERNHLKAFEQKTGFFNHGLSPEKLEECAPTPTDEEKAEWQKNRRGAHLKKYVTRLEDEQLNATITAYEQAKLVPNRKTKTSRLEEAAKTISQLEKKEIGGKAIEKRLKNLNYSDW